MQYRRWARSPEGPVAVATIKFLVIALIAAAVIGCGRPNPRLRAIGSTTFAYDDANQPTRIDLGDGKAVRFTFESARPTAVFIDDEDATRQIDFTYEGDRIVEGVIDQETTVAVTYDESGRVTAVGGRVFTYESTVLISLTEGEVVTQLTYDVGGLVNSVVQIGANAITRTYTYEGGRIIAIDELNGETPVSTTQFVYNNNGFISRRIVTPAGGDSVEVELEYDDGDVANIDITPSLFPPLSVLFDLRGRSYTSIDARTQVPRLFGLPW